MCVCVCISNMGEITREENDMEIVIIGEETHVSAGRMVLRSLMLVFARIPLIDLVTKEHIEVYSYAERNLSFDKRTRGDLYKV